MILSKIIVNLNASLAQMMDNEEAKQYLRSSPRYIMELLDYLREHYGSAKEYLLEIGLKNEEIEQLIENFTMEKRKMPSKMRI